MDDIVLYGPNKLRIADIISQLKGKFEVTDLGDTIYLLGIHIKYNQKGITLSQYNYINKVLHQFNMEDS